MCSRMPARSRPAQEPAQEAVSPVVGTLLVLAITVVGMAGIMLWGAPTIEAVQAQNAQVGVVGEFEELRASSIDLSIPDASRIPTVNVARGSLGIEAGTRMMVAADHDASNTGCDFHVTGWNGASPDTTVTVATTGCRTVVASGCTAVQACLEVLEVVGSNTVKRTITTFAGGVATVAGVDFSRGDWLFRLSDGSAVPAESAIYAQAWLVENDAITWRLSTTNGGVAAAFDLGAVFSSIGDADFVEKGPSLQESEFASGVFAFRLRTLDDTGSVAAVSGRGSHEVFLGLVGNHARIDRTDVNKLRLDMAGLMSESWCNLFVQRNQVLGTTSYAEDATLPCTQSSASAMRSVTYVRRDPATSAVMTPFEVEVLHADIRVTLSV